MCWSSLPGVAIKMFMAERRSFSCLSSLPPMMRPAEKRWRAPTCLRTWKVWRASSRVGETMRAPSPSSGPHRSRYSRSSTGTRNASVFPDPVFAAASTSFPARASGIPSLWISVARVHPARLSPSLVLSEIGMSENRMYWLLSCMCVVPFGD